MQACVGTGISGWVYEHIYRVLGINNEHFGVFAALLLTAAEEIQSIVQHLRAAPAVHARNSTGGNSSTLCCVVLWENFIGLMVLLWIEKKTSKRNVLLLLQSTLAEISAAVRGLFVMEKLQEEPMWTQTSTRPKVNLRKESCKDSEKTMLPHKVLVSFVLIILLW